MLCTLALILKYFPSYEVVGCEVVWAIKDKSIGQAFFDEGAATFFLPHLTSTEEGSSPEDSDPDQPPQYRVWKRTKYTLSTGCEETGKEREATNAEYGSALGPDWRSQLKMTGREVNQCGNYRVPPGRKEGEIGVTNILFQ